VFFATPFAFIQRQRRRKIYLETIEGSVPLFSDISSCWKIDRGRCSTGIDFQLGTNAADSNGSVETKANPAMKKSLKGHGRA
jgi:hypothetical protein